MMRGRFSPGFDVRGFDVRGFAAAIVLATSMSTSACGDLDDITTVKDLRVLAVRAEKSGFLIDLADPGAVADPADLQTTLTALVVDPTSGGQEITFSALGCPDFIDAITSATGQSTRVCAPAGQPPTPGLPPDLAMALATVEIAPSTPTAPTAAGGIEYQPVVPAFGFSPTQIRLFFTPQPAIPALDQSIAYNRDFGIDAIVDLSFNRGDQWASAIKRVVYWPDLRAEDPSEVPNQNPGIMAIEFFRTRNSRTGELSEPWLTMPVVSIGAKDKLYVRPVPAPDAVEHYPLRVRNTATRQVETRMMEELLVFDFFTTAGTFSPSERDNQPPILDPNAPIRLDSQLNLPALKDVPASGMVDLWIVAHDERAGSDWAHASIMITP